MAIKPAIANKELRDRVEVFLYNRLSQIISPHSRVQLTPSVRAGLIDDLNWLPGGYGFPPDLQDILNAFILININEISISTSQTITSRPTTSATV